MAGEENLLPQWIDAVGARYVGDVPLRPGGDQSLPVAQISFPFRRYNGPPVDRKRHMGKGSSQIWSLDGEPPERSCQEVEVVKRLRTVREYAFWFNGWPVNRETGWLPWARTLRNMPRWLADLDIRVRPSIAAPKGGVPDVVAWDSENALSSAIFVECKASKEAFKPSQIQWMSAAIDSGIPPSRIAVAVLPF